MYNSIFPMLDHYCLIIDTEIEHYLLAIAFTYPDVPFQKPSTSVHLVTKGPLIQQQTSEWFDMSKTMLIT